MTVDADRRGSSQDELSPRGWEALPLLTGALAAALVFLTALASIFVVHAQARGVLKDAIDEYLLGIASDAASRMDAGVHARIERPEQMSASEYRGLIAELRQIGKAHPIATYLYTVRSTPEGLRFVLDAAEPIDADADGVVDQAAVGEPCDQPDAALLRAFASGTPTVGAEPYTDRWGTFLGAYAPIRHPDGRLEAILGIDVDLRTYTARLQAMRRALALGGLVALILSLGVGVGVHSMLRARLASSAAERRTRLELRQAQDRLETAVRAARVGLWEWNVRVDSIWWSEECAELFGSPDDTPSSATSIWRRLLHHDDAASVESAMTAHLEGLVPEIRVECRVRDRKHRDRWIEVSGRVAERDPQGQPLRVSGAVLDIEPHKAASRKLEEARRWTRQVLESLPAGVVVEDRNGWLSDCNREAERILGLNRAEVVARRVLDPRWDLVREDGSPFPLEELPGAITLRTGHALRDVPLGIRLPGGEVRWLSVNSEPIRAAGSGDDPDAPVESVVISFTDVSAQWQARRELEAAKNAAESASRAKGEFLANMSHEIRTPMTAILGFARLLDEDPETASDPERRHDALQTIRRNGEHLLAVINDILDLSRIEAGRLLIERVPVDAASIAEEVVALLRSAATAKRLSIDCRIEGTIPTTASDPVRIRQVLVNLIGNAIKFTRCGGVAVEVSHDVEARTIAFSVADTGIGIAPDSLQELFEPFTQADASTSRRFGGSGLGLAISRRLAGLLSGTLRAESQPGSGSRFTLTIPVRPAAVPDRHQPIGTAAPSVALSNAPGAESNALGSQASSGGALVGVRILVADDQADIRRLLEQLLTAAGADVEAVCDGTEVLARLGLGTDSESVHRTPSGRFDLVLLDMEMPGLDGYTTAHRLCAAEGVPPVIAVTAHAAESDRRRALAAGCVDHLPKPIDAATLLDACRRHARSGVES